MIIVFFIFLICSCIGLFINKKSYEKYYYRFYKNRLEYCNSFFWKKVIEVKYEDFKEIKYNQGYMQSKFNQGELWILTNNKNFFKKILMFKSIPNVEQEYEKIVKIFNA